jgi:hypothetical protein
MGYLRCQIIQSRIPTINEMGVILVNHIEEALRFIESEEMREHLRAWPKPLDRNDCAEIVSRAPTSIEKKIPVLDLIAEQTVYDPDRVYYDPVILAKHARIALDELYNMSPGSVLLIEGYCHEREASARELFTSFEAVQRYISEHIAIWKDPNHEDFLWFYLEKWIPQKDGKMESTMSWFLNSLGEVWYFEYEDEPEEFFDALGFFDRLGDLDYSIPFKSGDIIIADCRPFAEERKVLILVNREAVGSVDCCAVRCLFITPNGKVDECALKHNSFLRYPEHTYFSVLYRASVYDGEITDTEIPLSVISKAIKENPQLGYDIHDYLIDLSLSTSREEKHEGVEWEHLKVKFGI